MYCIDNHKELVKTYNYIKNNRKTIKKNIEFLNLDTSKSYVTNFVYNFDLVPLRNKLLIVYKNLKDNPHAPKTLIEFLSVFVSLKFPDTIVDFIYTFINDKNFYKNILFIFSYFADITKCINLTTDKITKNDMDRLLKYYNYDISKIKNIFKISTFNLLVLMSKLYPDPIKTFKIKLGRPNPKYKNKNRSITKEFKDKYPKAKLGKINRDDRIGLMYYCFLH